MNKSISSLHQKITEDAASMPLSQLLPQTLTLARKLKNKDLEKWVRLELDGYFNTNPMLTNDDVVPEYRTIAGQRCDEFRRPLVFTDSELEFINEDRLRQGVAELEHLATSKGMLSYRDLHAAQILREHLGVEVTIFTFPPSEIHSVLSRIRATLVEQLSSIEPEVEKLDNPHNRIESHEGVKPRPSGKWHIIAISSFVVFLITAAVFFVSNYLQPILPSNTNNTILLLIASLTGVLALLASLNEVVELFQKIFGNRGGSQSSTKHDPTKVNERAIYDGTQGFHGYDITPDFSQYTIQQGVLVVQEEDVGVILRKYIFDGKEYDFIPKNELISGERKFHISCELKVIRASYEVNIFMWDKLEEEDSLDDRVTTATHAEWRKIDLYFRAQPDKDYLVHILATRLSETGSLQIRNLIVAERIN